MILMQKKIILMTVRTTKPTITIIYTSSPMIYSRILTITSMLAILAACLSFLSSCRTDNQGYPKSVFISAEGDSVTIEGEKWVSFVEFLNNDTFNAPTETAFDEQRNVMIYKYGWLTVESPKFGHTLTLTANPNKTTAQRTISIQPTFINSSEYGLIKVTQGYAMK